MTSRLRSSRSIATLTLTVTVTLALLVALGGCGGGPGPQSGADPASATSSTPPDVQGVEHPLGEDDVVLRVETGGGLVRVEDSFAEQPRLLLTGDGRLFVPPDRAGPSRVVAMQVAQLDEDQVEALLTLADDAGLLAPPPDYTDTSGPQVMDAATTTVILTAAGGTWRHEAYALGTGEESGARADLLGFLDDVRDEVAGVETEPFEPSELALLVQVTDLDRTVVPWPSAAVSLAGVDGCAVVPAARLLQTLGSAAPTASFLQDDVLYAVSAAEVLPGDQLCVG